MVPVQTWRQRLAAVLEWSAVDKGQVLLMMLVPILGQYLVWIHYVLHRPDRERLINVPVMEQLFRYELGLIAGALLLVLAGRVLRRRQPDRLWFQYVSAQYYALTLVFCSYYVGMDSISTGVVLLGAPVFGFIVLNRQVVWLASASAVTAIVALSHATTLGHLPYAPAMVPPADAASALFRQNSMFSFTAPHLIFIFLLADQTLNWWRKREDTIRVMSLTDALTGVPNRRSIMEQLDKEVARTRRHGPPLCVAILDLDHFKKINDTHGHPTGDKVLQEAARVLRDAIRSCDYIGRYGGEEFMVVLPDTTTEGAAVLLERCRSALATTLIRAETGKTFHINASFGVVCNQKDMGRDAEALIKAADDALYRAKEGGRNRVELTELAG